MKIHESFCRSSNPQLCLSFRSLFSICRELRLFQFSSFSSFRLQCEPEEVGSWMQTTLDAGLTRKHWTLCQTEAKQANRSQRRWRKRREKPTLLKTQASVTPQLERWGVAEDRKCESKAFQNKTSDIHTRLSEREEGLVPERLRVDTRRRCRQVKDQNGPECLNMIVLDTLG